MEPRANLGRQIFHHISGDSAPGDGRRIRFDCRLAGLSSGERASTASEIPETTPSPRRSTISTRPGSSIGMGQDELMSNF